VEVKYGDIHHQARWSFPYNFEEADVSMLLQLFTMYEKVRAPGGTGPVAGL
jgi:glycyl-tRNA synthetase alpha chain